MVCRAEERTSCRRTVMSPCPLDAVEEQFDVAAQMIDQLDGELGSTCSFRKNESALQHNLSVQSQAASGPSRLDVPCFDRGGYIRLDPLGMTADRAGASIADRRMAVIGFLYHRAHEAGELTHRAGQNCFAEVDVAEHAVERIGMGVIGRRCEKFAACLRVPLKMSRSHGPIPSTM